MKRRKQNLDGLSLPINSFAVVLQLLSIFGLMASFLPCLHFMANFILWPSVAIFGVTAILLFLFKGFPLFVFYGRFVLGFLFICSALVQVSSMDQFGYFLRTACDGINVQNNMLGFLYEHADLVAVVCVALEFVVGVALLIGAWVRFASIGSLIIAAFYLVCFWNLLHLNTLNIDESGIFESWNFKLDGYLAKELTNTVCLVFACCMAYISALGIVVGQKIYPNSVKLNWYLLPILSGLSACFSVLLHWYVPLFLIPLTLMTCLLIYRSGGRFLANHFGSLLIALGFIVCFLQFQKPLGIEMKPAKEIKTKSKQTDRFE